MHQIWIVCTCLKITKISLTNCTVSSDNRLVKITLTTRLGNNPGLDIPRAHMTKQRHRFARWGGQILTWMYVDNFPHVRQIQRKGRQSLTLPTSRLLQINATSLYRAISFLVALASIPLRCSFSVQLFNLGGRAENGQHNS